MWRGHPWGLLHLLQHSRDCSSVFFTFHTQITAEKSMDVGWSYSLTAPPRKCSVLMLFLTSLSGNCCGVKCSTSWEERLAEVIVPEQGLWFYGKQAITVLIFYASLQEPFIYCAPRKIFPFNTLLLNVFSMQPEMMYFLTYCVLLSFLCVCVWLHTVLCCFMDTALTYVFSCNRSVQEKSLQ